MRSAGNTGASPRRCSIRLICESYPPVLGGTEIEAQRVAAALRSRGHEISILTAGGDGRPRERRRVDSYGVPVQTFGVFVPEFARQIAYALGVAWTLLRECRDYEVVYLLMGGLQLVTALPVARLLRKGIVMKFSGSNTIAPIARSWIGRLELIMLRRWAHRILVLNPAMTAEAVAVGLPESRLGWMPNPVDIEQFRPLPEEERARLRRERDLPPEARLVLFVGRLAPEKQLPSLVEAFASVVRRRPETFLILLGDGPLKGELEDLAANLGIREHVVFTGSVAPDEVCRWLQISDVFALVSSLEGFSCSLIESMAVGLPTVVSRIPANTQLVADEQQGLVVPCGDAPAISAALLRLLDDSKLRADLGASGRRLVAERYSMDRVITLYEQLFTGVIRTKCAGGGPL